MIFAILPGDEMKLIRGAAVLTLLPS